MQGDPQFERINMIVTVEEETRNLTFRFAGTRMMRGILVQGGPSASGKIYVDIKFKVPSLA